jgi:hypothetical protein
VVGKAALLPGRGRAGQTPPGINPKSAGLFKRKQTVLGGGDKKTPNTNTSAYALGGPSWPAYQFKFKTIRLNLN